MTHSRLIGLLAGVLASGGAAAQIEIPEQASVEQVAPGLHVIRAVGGNIALSAGPDGVLIVDDDMPPVAGKIAAAIATVTPEPVSLVFNTHWHFDHAGGNRYFGERGALIVAQDNVRKRLSEKQFSKLSGTTTPPAPAAALPVITFDQQLTFHLNGLTIRAEHVAQPAHTDGDAIIFFEEINVVHMGDTFFNGNYPFVDLSSGGHINGVIEAAATALALGNADTKIIPGHGALASKADLKAYHDMLVTIRDRVESLMATGKSREEVQAARPTSDFDATVDPNGFISPERLVDFIFDSLSDD